MLELVDRMVSKTIVRNGVWVRFPLPAPTTYLFELTDRYEINQKWLIFFKILKQAIDMSFGFMVCSEKNPLRICKHCGKVFYAKNPKAEYDSSQCRNQANVYKSRNKNKDTKK